MTEKILIIPHLKVQNANALSSPFTVGFPAMTSWLGCAHALQRKLNQKSLSASFDGIGVVSHKFNLQTYKGPGDYTSSIIVTRNPLTKDGKSPSFIEEARCHLEVSLIIKVHGIEKSQENDVIKQVSHYLNSQMKVAGGDILTFEEPKFYRDLDLIKTKLMPGYALIERRELMLKAMEQGKDALDAMMDYLAIHHYCEQTEENGVKWKKGKKTNGWIIPIATGFQGISELGKAVNQRDPDVPHRFAETIVTLGEFKMVYRLNHFREIFWHYSYDEDNNLYFCQQSKKTDSGVLEEGF